MLDFLAICLVCIASQSYVSNVSVHTYRGGNNIISSLGYRRSLCASAAGRKPLGNLKCFDIRAYSIQ